MGVHMNVSLLIVLIEPRVERNRRKPMAQRLGSGPVFFVVPYVLVQNSKWS